MGVGVELWDVLGNRKDDDTMDSDGKELNDFAPLSDSNFTGPSAAKLQQTVLNLWGPKSKSRWEI